METYKPFTQRVIQGHPEILGLRMLHLTLGHILILKANNSKFITGGINECSYFELIHELIFAILVCSTTYDDFNDEVHNGKFAANVKEYADKLMSDLGDTKIKRQFKKLGCGRLFKSKKPKYFNIYDHIRDFAEYLNKGTTGPLYVVKESKDGVGSKDNPLEPEEAMIDTLTTEKGWTLDDCYNRPLTQVLSTYLTHAHKQEVIVLISKETSELMQRMKGELV